MSSWQRQGPTRSAASLRLVINGVDEDIFPSLADAPNFTYYLPQSLVVSAVYPVGGPTHGGTSVTLHGSGFGPLGGAL